MQKSAGMGDWVRGLVKKEKAVAPKASLRDLISISRKEDLIDKGVTKKLREGRFGHGASAVAGGGIGGLMGANLGAVLGSVLGAPGAYAGYALGGGAGGYAGSYLGRRALRNSRNAEASVAALADKVIHTERQRNKAMGAAAGVAGLAALGIPAAGLSGAALANHYHSSKKR